MGGGIGGISINLGNILKQLEKKDEQVVKQPMVQELQDVSTANNLSAALANYKKQQEQASSMPAPDQVQRSQAVLKAEPLGAPMKTDAPTVANKRSGNFAMSLEEFMKRQKGEM